MDGGSTESARATRSWLYPAGVLALAAVYFVAAKVGLSLAFMVEQVSVVWPPSGVALATLVLAGERWWPGVALGAFLANATANEPIAVAGGIAVGNTLEAVLGARLLARAEFDATLERVRDVLVLLTLAAGVSTIVSASVGVTMLCLGGLASWADSPALWGTWWLGDASGDLLFAPALLAWFARSAAWPPRRATEALVLTAGLSVVSALVFLGAGERPVPGYPLTYTILPFVIWAALRFGPRGTATVIVAALTVAIVGTSRGTGPFAEGALGWSLVQLHLYMAVVAVSSLLLGAAVAERGMAERRRAVGYVATAVLAESPSLVEAAPRLLRVMGEDLGWDAGALWSVDRDARVLRCIEVWHRPGVVTPAFAAARRQRTFAPEVGLPGRVWAAGRAAWIADVSHDESPPGTPCASGRLRGAFAFPIVLGAEVLGVVEFFSCRIRRPDRDLFIMLAALGSQIGQFVERRQAGQAVLQSEARKAAILESALDAIITIDHEGRIVEFNPAAERTFGCTRTAVIGQAMSDFIIPLSQREQLQHGLARYLATGEGPILGKRLEVPALRADGTEFPAELAVARISSPGPPMFTGYVRDITERKRMEQQLRDRADELAAADRRKDEFLAMLAHELRNPLASICNAVHVLKAVDSCALAARRAREVLGRQVHHLVRLVDDLLDVSRILRGRIELRKERVELAAVIARAVEMASPAVEVGGHELSVSLPPEPVGLVADPVRLAQVVANLLHNAAKYTEHGGRIWLAAGREGEQAVVRVRDTGVGIGAEVLPRIFDLFVQADRSLDRAQGGMGIGLTLVRSLVELHGGSVSATSGGPGAGSEFVVRLPVAAADRAPPVATAPRGPPPSRRRVLVVDDNRDAAESLATLLWLEGQEVRVAHDGPAALASADADPPELVLLDIGMPGMDGCEVARRLRARPALERTAIVALTGWGQEEDRQRTREAGFDEHLVKPVDLDRLRVLLAQCARRPADGYIGGV